MISIAQKRNLISYRLKEKFFEKLVEGTVYETIREEAADWPLVVPEKGDFVVLRECYKDSRSCNGRVAFGIIESVKKIKASELSKEEKETLKECFVFCDDSDLLKIGCFIKKID